MKSKLGTIAFVLVLLAIAGWWAHDKYHQATQTRVREKHRQALDEHFKDATSSAAKRYSAITDWEKAFTDSLSQPFSIELEDTLVSARPILIIGVVEDIARRDGHSYLYLNDWNISGATIHFILECDAASISHIVKTKEKFEDVGVIAKIDSVEKTQIALKSGGKTSEDTEPIELDSSSLFVARGKCLEILSHTDSENTKTPNQSLPTAGRSDE